MWLRRGSGQRRLCNDLGTPGLLFTAFLLELVASADNLSPPRPIPGTLSLCLLAAFPYFASVNRAVLVSVFHCVGFALSPRLKMPYSLGSI